MPNSAIICDLPPHCLLAVAQPTAYSVTSIVLGSGLFVLSVALLIMMWSRWGEARPVAKCVGLSILAHILLMVYAYSTNMLQPVAGQKNGDDIAVRMVTDEHADTPEVREWDQAVSDFVPESAVPDLPMSDPVDEPTAESEAMNELTEDSIVSSIPLPEEVWDEPEVPIDGSTAQFENDAVPASEFTEEQIQAQLVKEEVLQF